MKQLSVYLIGAVVVVSLAACSSTDVVAPTMNVSIGKQLMDLKKAEQSGAISQREWERQKAEIISSVK
jgi:uncharacterized lipoprotein YbaY